jgi:superfamily I DNA/RNA helicase
MSQIALYHKAFDQLFKLPKRVQKDVSNFLEKFRENSKNPGLHIEPISTFSDPQLRTGRVNQQYRAILHAPKTGDLYHLLHVDNHDEAMDWAENKIFEWNDFTQSYQVFASPDVVIVPEPTSPTLPAPAAAQKDAFHHQSNEELLAIGVPAILMPSVREVSNLEELEKLYDYLPIEALENLSMLIEGSNYDTIIREVKEGMITSDDRNEQENSPNNQRSFFELTNDDLLNRMLEGEVAKWKIFLHPSQKRLVEGNFNGPTKVTGGAGTGKTVAALHRAKELQERGTATPQQPILFTTYTKSLAANLKDELKSLEVDDRIVKLNNLDNLAMKSARDAGLIAKGNRVLDFSDHKEAVEIWQSVIDFKLTSYSAEFLHAEYQHVILYQGITSADEYYHAARRGRERRISRKNKVEIWKLIEAYEELKKQEGFVDLFEVYNALTAHYNAAAIKPFRHVIADELQDFSNIHLRLLRSLVAEQPDDLFLVGDPLQQIYGRKIIFSEAGINVRGRRSRRLKINYRTTEKIRRAAVGVIEGIDFSDFEDGIEDKKGYVSLRGGLAPTYELHKTSTAEQSKILERLQAYLFPGASDEPIPASSICVAVRTRNAAKAFRTMLHTAGIPYYDLTERNSPVGNRKEGVWLSTFHNLKGLEFKVVFLADVSAATFPFRPNAYDGFSNSEKRAFDEGERALLYVGMTRAVARVHISGVGSPADYLPSLVNEL